MTDAAVVISAMRGTAGGRHEVEVNSNGSYRFPEISPPGRYHLQAESQRWTPISYSANKVIDLKPGQQAVRDYVMPRACRLRLRIVDEAGLPIAGALARVAALFRPNTLSTDNGEMLMGGLPPSDEAYRIAVMHKRHAPGHIQIKLTDTERITEQIVRLQQGIAVRGVAVCRDGKPPSGWEIRTLPRWFARFGNVGSASATIGGDGSFELPHIGDGEYNVWITAAVTGRHGMPTRLVMKDESLVPGQSVYFSVWMTEN